MIKRNRKYNKEVIYLSALISSYFYCLPLGRFSISFFSSDFRIYDFGILIFILYSINGSLYGRILKIISKKFFFPYYLRYLFLLAILSLFLYPLYGTSLMSLLPASIRIYRFFAYLYTGAAVIAIATDTAKFKILFWVFMGNIVLQAVIATLQTVGILQNFWPQYWLNMYDVSNMPVATLAPHHKHMGVIMLIGVSLGLGLVQLYNNKPFKRLFWIIGTLIMFTIPMVMGTRTFMLSIGFVFLAYIYLNKAKSIGLISMFLIVGVIFFSIYSDKVFDRIEASYETRVKSRIEKSGISGVAQERENVYLKVASGLINEPYLILTGTGFQNMVHVLGPVGAHNNFLTALAELGLLGLYLFTKFVSRVNKNLRLSYKHADSKFIHIIVKYIWLANVGIVASMMVGETIWGQRAMFTLPGQCIFLFGLGVAPLYWKMNKAQLSNV